MSEESEWFERELFVLAYGELGCVEDFALLEEEHQAIGTSADESLMLAPSGQPPSAREKALMDFAYGLACWRLGKSSHDASVSSVLAAKLNLQARIKDLKSSLHYAAPEVRGFYQRHLDEAQAELDALNDPSAGT